MILFGILISLYSCHAEKNIMASVDFQVQNISNHGDVYSIHAIFKGNIPLRKFQRQDTISSFFSKDVLKQKTRCFTVDETRILCEGEYLYTITMKNYFKSIRDFSTMSWLTEDDYKTMGIDGKYLLNKEEIEYVCSIFQLNEFQRQSIRNVIFIYDTTISNKQKYFKMEKDRYISGLAPSTALLYIFDPIQKKKSGGYDAAIVLWNKIILSPEQVIKIGNGKR